MNDIAIFRSLCPHETQNWEYNPKTQIYSLRCIRCGSLIETLTESQWEARKI